MSERIFSPKILLAFLVLFLSFGLVLSVEAALININTANSAELQTLNGIGPAKAQTIIDYRNTNSPFAKIEDIRKVSGIGEVTFSNIKDFITVGGDSIQQDSGANNAATTVPTATTVSQNVSTPNSSSTLSAHYSATSLSATKPEIKLVLGAGRDRLGVVGGPLEFKVETNSELTRNNIFKWNFGDGMLGVGEVTNHSYFYPGEYVVVLNVSGPEGQAVSRNNVRIVSPELSISSASPERIEIANNSKVEANLFGRAIVSGTKIFPFPQDTIIKAGQKISFDSHITGLIPFGLSGVSLVVVGTEVQPQEVIAEMERQRLEKITSIRDEINALEQRKLALSQRETSNAKVTTEDIDRQNSLPQTALVFEAVATSTFTPERSSGWLETIKRFFLRTR